MKIYEDILGVDHIDTALIYHNIGFHYSKKNEYEEAMKY